MKIKSLIFLSVTALILSNCIPARIVKDQNHKKVPTAKVKITREDRFMFMGIQAIVGYDNEDRAKLWNDSSTEIEIPVGKHEFYVRSNQSRKAPKLVLDIKNNERVCLQIKVDGDPIIKHIIPFLYLNYNSFKIEKENSCR